MGRECSTVPSLAHPGARTGIAKGVLSLRPSSKWLHGHCIVQITFLDDRTKYPRPSSIGNRFNATLAIWPSHAPLSHLSISDVVPGAPAAVSTRTTAVDAVSDARDIGRATKFHPVASCKETGAEILVPENWIVAGLDRRKKYPLDTSIGKLPGKLHRAVSHPP